ncbi:PilC/PilY family type IV pilus protein [Thermoanaerobaculum aquaticum]|uniref:PilC/PilY family type IV pilus protein n=1 Tax=Thermoanaerobaculum aquaticum TaxID=1312852 RepID=UPI001378FCE0|nr:PilC/PilY family type IV pilus protein [Thermoanaerobaculum aquaticum]
MTCQAMAPAPPFDTAALPAPRLPRNVVGRYKDKINWAVLTYSYDEGDPTVSISNCDTCTVNREINYSMLGDVTSILDKMKLAKDGGFKVWAGTPTKGALKFAKEVIQKTKDGLLFTDYQGQVFSPPGDALAQCRLWGVLLITDGASNYCNPESGEPGGRDNWWNDCATNASSNWADYPPGEADAIFNLWSPNPPRTFAIGLSADVNQCELNWTAFKGRTDASAPLGDGGVKYQSDPRLWDPVNGTWANFDPSAPYAFFALTPEQFEQAVEAVPASLGTGDYVTGPPSGAPSASGTGTVGLIASVKYPTWQGHLYAYDVTNKVFDAPPYFPLLWDAGQVLASGNNGFARKIYTWNPITKDLILIDDPASDAATLNALCGGCGITPQVVDFMLGNDGTLTNTRRPWLLGALVNSTPAIIGAPEHWTQSIGLDTQRRDFEATYSTRHSIVWVGASDGMLHAFDLVDGAEVLAIAPPDLLDTQVRLFTQYSLDPVRFPMGQPAAADRHIYGVASSPRFADVYDGSKFRTVLYLTEGPGGTGLHALDVTHIYPGRTIDAINYPADPNYSATKPFEPLFSITQNGEAGTSAVSGLKLTLSVPAVARDETNVWRVMVARGYPWPSDPNKLTAPQVFVFDALTGALLDTETLSSLADAKVWVKNQALADTGFFQTRAKFFRPDNAADQGVQPDLHGQLWVLDRLTASSFKATVKASLADKFGSRFVPFYFPSAENGWPTNDPKYDVYALASGSYYENSWFINPPTTTWNGGNFFRAGLHVVVDKFDPPKSTNTLSLWVEDQKHPDPDNPPLNPGDPVILEPFSPRSQPTAPPFLFVPEEKKGGADVLVVALIYDPDAEFCFGHTYLVTWKVKPSDLSNPGEFKAYEGGKGASSGILVTPSGIVFAKSWVGSESEGNAYFEPPQVPIDTGGAPTPRGILWWREVQ